MKKSILFLSILFYVISCDKTYVETPLSEALIGNWSSMEIQDSIHILTLSNSLPVDEYGIAFKENGEVMEWKNVGWCGTPPITYGEHDGEWSISTDSIITLETEYWGGKFLSEWKILDLDSQQLRYYVRSQQNVPDE